MVRRFRECPTCGHRQTFTACPECKGKGSFQYRPMTASGMSVLETSPCKACGGTGIKDGKGVRTPGGE